MSVTALLQLLMIGEWALNLALGALLALSACNQSDTKSAQTAPAAQPVISRRWANMPRAASRWLKRPMAQPKTAIAPTVPTPKPAR